MTTEATSAREFIERIAEISRAHGARGDLTDESYEQAVKEADDLFRYLRPTEQ